MCGECLREKLPERGTMCLETGAYFLNFKACKECG
jgi:Churchill protein